jgi:hypothetical protein
MKKDIIEHLKVILDLREEECGEYLEAFAQSFDECCLQLEPLRQGELDYGRLRVVTHTLIGFSENMGAMDLLALSKSLNAAAKEPDEAACRRDIERIFALRRAYQDEA